MATTSGTLVNDISSPYSSPYVHYSCTYTATRAINTTTSISVTLNFKGWLQSSGSYLGTGKGLVIYARLSGSSSWKSVTIKTTSATWSGTTKHSASAITLSGKTAGNKITVEFYVARIDSTGNSGKLGSKSSPKKYDAKLPTYTAPTTGDSTSTPTSPTTPTVVEETMSYRFNVNGTWKRAQRYQNINGVWEETIVRVNINGTWKNGDD